MKLSKLINLSFVQLNVESKNVTVKIKMSQVKHEFS